MCLSPAHFHQFLHPSIDSHYEGPAKSGMIVEIQGHPKHLLMPNCLGIVINVPQTITIFVGVHCTPIKVFLWVYMGVHGHTLYAHKKLLGFFCGRTCTPMYAHGRTIMWAYKFFIGVQCTSMYAHGRTGCNLWAYWAYMGVQGRTWV